MSIEIPHRSDSITSDAYDSTVTKRRRREAKGLPDDVAIRAMATTYLEVQRPNWPALVKSGWVAASAEIAATDRLLVEFKKRFLDPSCTPELFHGRSIANTVLGLAYLRYSDDNSNPRSLAQQLRNILERANRDQVFILWEWVYADAAVSGTTAARRGYQMAKLHIETDGAGQFAYLDELGRAARDAIESLTLGRSVDDHQKRMIGASDNFDSEQPQSKLMLAIYSSLNEWFVEQLRSKVNRGMRDAFLAGRNVNLPALGHKLVPEVDSEGRPVCDAEGKSYMVKVIDDDEAAHVKDAFHRLAEGHWSSC